MLGRRPKKTSCVWQWPNLMKLNFFDFSGRHGMALVLLLLCLFFSGVTLTEQSPSGDAAARQVATSVRRQFPEKPQVLVVTSGQPGDLEFFDGLVRDLPATAYK